jgi:EmrB/QacA subfamily drug resistance transporter
MPIPSAFPAAATRIRDLQGQGHPWLSLAAVSLGLMMVMLDATVVAIANPSIGLDLHASLSGLQWVTNAYLLAVAVTIMAAGKLGDRFGRKRAFLTGVVGFALASAACGLAPSIGTLIGFRVAQGLAGALLMPATLAIIRAAFPERLLQQAIGIWAGVSAVAIASGPIVAGLLVEHASWRWVFFLNLPVAVCAVAVGGWAIKESRDERASEETLDLAGIALLSVSLFALVWGIIKSETLGWSDVVTLSSLAGAAVGLTLFALYERRIPHPLLPLGLFRSRSLSVGVVLVLILMFALFGTIFYLALALQRVYGYSPVETGVRTLPLTATLVLAAPLGGFLTARIGPRLPLAGGMALVGCALLGFSRFTPHTGYTALLIWLFVIGIALGLVQTASADVVVGNAPVRLAGVAGGLQQTALQIGGALGTSVLGAVLANRAGAVFLGKLIAAGVPAQPAHALAEQHGAGAVAQGIPPIPAGSPAALAARITDASFASFTHGLDIAFVVAACIAFAAALLALVVRRSDAVDTVETER